MHRAPLIEIFHSVQGEGRHVGRPMVFLRVATCPIRCRYCDTPQSYAASESFPVRLPDGDALESNPVAADRAAVLVAELNDVAPMAGAARTLSVTGGEPLVFPDFVAELGAQLRERGWLLHLETAALDPDAMSRVAPAFDHVSADYKLPETLAAGAHGPAHRRCVDVALAAGCSVDVKVVLTPEVAAESFAGALSELRGVRERVLLILQPVTPFGAVTAAPGTAQLQSAAGVALSAGFDVRVLPQVHKQLDLP